MNNIDKAKLVFLNYFFGQIKIKNEIIDSVEKLKQVLSEREINGLYNNLNLRETGNIF
jgi:hypothetical protein